MANLKLYPNGLTAGIPGKPPQTRGIRSECSGWSRSAVRSFLRVLYALDLCDVFAHSAKDTLRAFAFTLTVKDVPPTPDHWKRLRESFFRELYRQGVSRLIWLTEWQSRGAPHLHGIVVLPAGFSNADFLACWVWVSRTYRSSSRCQTCTPIHDPFGWCEYLGKHSARGVHHYQRSSANIPAAWQGRTGRMWGKRGDWLIREPIPIAVDRASFFRLRRVLRGKAISEARGAQRWLSLSFCRRSLKCPDPVRSRLRGVSQFIPHDQVLAILDGIGAWLIPGEQQK